ncbi:hypothetical protein BDV96DRAFT_687630 [Lophiotrema nucula]|uniref:Uncharacterized protein n=1 Tax=Lophiotrema nucula TaxID=690887 RepID=A0A6A5Z8Y4_9PLEO|nr:hypothetical protein BDV96DRAFT_687630 [Lophiotrema nucula]
MSQNRISRNKSDSAERPVLEITDEYRAANQEAFRNSLRLKNIFDHCPNLQQEVKTLKGYLMQNQESKRRIAMVTITEEEVEKTLREQFILESQNQGMDAYDDMDITAHTQIIHLLNYDSRVHDQGEEQCEVLKSNFAGIDKMVEDYVYASSGFEQWFTDARVSSILLVDRNSSRVGSAKLSALSVVSNTLENVSYLSRSIISVKHFCGLHSDADSAAENWVPNMVKGLITQLLMKDQDQELNFDLSFITEEARCAMQENKLDVLCNVFRHMVQQIPQNRMFLCILDSISSFEVSTIGKADMLKVLGLFKDASLPEKGCTTKLLLTVANGTSILNPAGQAGQEWVDYIVTVPKSLRNMNGEIFRD